MKFQADIKIPDEVIPGGRRGETLLDTLEKVIGLAVVGLHVGTTVSVKEVKAKKKAKK